VWELLSEPGWWINDGTVTEHRVETEGDISVVHDPVHGTFRMQLDPPRYAGYRWLSEAGSDEPGEASTLIEFWISDRPDGGVALRVVESGGVALRVVESGFDSLDASAEQRRKTLGRCCNSTPAAGWRTSS
jgi:hypothetical protein